MKYFNPEGCLVCRRCYHGKHNKICDGCVTKGYIVNPAYSNIPNGFFRGLWFMITTPEFVQLSVNDFQI
jgi:hypothetical protein